VKYVKSNVCSLHAFDNSLVRMSVLRRGLARGVIPTRALKPVQGVNIPSMPGSAPAPDEESKRTIPHIPREFAKDTIEFFRQSSPHVKSLLDLVFSPSDPQVSDADQAEYDRMKKEYETELNRRRKRYAVHEQRASSKMFDALRNLPEDMYDEAVSKGEMLPPESLQFHEMYKDQLMENSLSDWELFKLQTFSNLMHIRYSHSEAKKKHKDKFFISESAALNLRKERAKKEKMGG
jgi:hypothetical protein